MKTTAQAQETILTRTILASPSRVYAAFTQPEGWCEWCCEQAEADAHVGGKLHIYTEGYNAYGEFTVLGQDRTVAFTWNGDGEPPTLIHVLLDGQDTGTITTFRVTSLGPEQDWAGFAAFLERTWGHALNNLKAVLEAKSGIVKFVELPNQVRLPYVEQGDPLGVPVLLLHGFTDSWRSFELVLLHLPVSIHAIALTQRGHGDASRPPAGYCSHDLAADLAAFMDALHLEAAVIVGASSGGIVAQRFAIDYPERTLGLVLASSPVTLQNKPGVRELWDSTISKLTDPIDPGFVRKFAEGSLSQRVPPPFFEAMVQDSLKVPAHVWKATTEGLLEEDHSAELDKIQSPTLIIWGDQDTFTRGDQEALTAAIAGSLLVVYPGAGHSPHWEEPERFASDLVAFVEAAAIGTRASPSRRTRTPDR